MTYLPSLYKARGIPVKSPICAICLDRTRGKTLERQLTHGVRIWLCEGHHSVAFMRRNAGRDFVVTLTRSWRSNGCLTRARNLALNAHLAAIRATGARSHAPRPGSYAWPRLRREAEPASPAATASSRPSPVFAPGICSTTPPFPASAPCAGGSATVAGSAYPRRPMRRVSRG